MVEKTDYRGVIGPVRGIPEAEQRELIASYAPSEVYTLGKNVTLENVVNQQRPPRAVVVSDAVILAAQKGDKDARFDGFAWFLEAIHRKGGWIEEARTRLRSDRPRDRAAIRKNAKDGCRRLAQGANSARNARRGAKPWDADLSRADKVALREEWYVKPGRTVDGAVAAIKKRLGKKAPGRTVLYREFGLPVMKKR